MNKEKKKRELRQRELEDIEGIRQTKSGGLTLKQLYATKITMIILIIIFFFVYSPALIFLLLIYALLFFLSTATEKSINKSFLKRNRLKIPKFDHAVALIVVVISIIVGLSGATTQTKVGTFEDLSDKQIASFIKRDDFSAAREMVEQNKTNQEVIDIFSLMTGERNVFSSSSNGASNFGFATPPEDFTPPENFEGFKGKPDGDIDFDPDNMPTPPEDFDFKDFRENNMGPKNFDFNLNDMPVYYIFSSMISIIASVLVFMVPLLGILQMVFTAIKKKKIENQTYSSIQIASDFILSEDLLDKLLQFGEDNIKESDFE